MKLCPKCNNSPLPFVMVAVVASLAAFMTWLTVGFGTREVWPPAVAAVLVFFAVGATLLHYVLACMKRHCRHGEDESPLERLRRRAAEHAAK